MIIIGIDERLVNRFVSKIEFRDGCWLWCAGRNPMGYGKFWYGGKTHGAHRFSYELFVGPIPGGLTLDHLCRIRHCVYPTHLEPVTIQENLQRSPSRPEKRTHCPSGHPYAGENLVRVADERRCRICVNATAARHRLTPSYKEWLILYQAQPIYKERQRLYQQRYLERRRVKEKVTRC